MLNGYYISVNYTSILTLSAFILITFLIHLYKGQLAINLIEESSNREEESQEGRGGSCQLEE